MDRSNQCFSVSSIISMHSSMMLFSLLNSYYERIDSSLSANFFEMVLVPVIYEIVMSCSMTSVKFPFKPGLSIIL
jgi:hypothetical protein